MSASSSARVKPLPDTIALMLEGYTRRSNRSVRATLHIDYCLHSLRIPWPTDYKRTRYDVHTDTNYIHLRAVGKLRLRADAVAVIDHHLIGVLETPCTNHTGSSLPSFHAGVIMDTLLPLYASTLPSSGVIHHLDPITQDTIEDHQSLVYNILFSRDAVVTDRRRHILCKLLPRVAMPRRFLHLLHRYIGEDHEFRREFTEIMICSLLGNYEHCPDNSRADLGMRLVVYGVCMPIAFEYVRATPIPPIIDSAIRGMLLRGTVLRLPLFALREYLIFLIDQDPITRRHACALFGYELFRSTVLQAMADVRIYIRTNLRDGGTMTAHTVDSGMFEDDLDEILEVAYDTIVAGAYRKPRPLPLQLIKDTKGKCPPTTAWAGVFGKTLVYCTGPTSDEKCSVTRKRTRGEKEARNENGGSDEDDDDDDDADDDGRVHDEEQDGSDEEENEEREEKRMKKAARPVRRYMTTHKRRKPTKQQKREAAAATKGGGGGGEDEEEEEDVYEGKEEKRGAGNVRNILAKMMAERDDEELVMNLVDAVGEEERESKNENAGWDVVVIEGEGKVADPAVAVVTRECVLVEHCRMLREVVQTIDPQTDPMEAFKLILGHLSVFGAPQEALDEHLVLAQRQYDDGVFTLSRWQEQLESLRVRYPYTYNLLQTGAALWAKHIDIQRIRLPAHYARSQMMAVSDRYGMVRPEYDSLPDFIPDRACKLVFCRICGNIYSIVRKQQLPPKKKHKRPKPPPTHGYMEARSDLTTGLLYCSRNQAYMDQKCGDEPLTEVTMIGDEILLHGESYMICGGCGQVALMHNYNTTFTEHGIACYSCTIRIRSAPPELPESVKRVQQLIINRREVHRANKQEVDDEKKRELPEGVRCFLCPCVIATEASCRMFGHSTFVCNRHPIHRLREHVRAGLRVLKLPAEVSGKEEIEEAVRGLLLENMRQRKAIHEETHNRIQMIKHKWMERAQAVIARERRA